MLNAFQRKSPRRRNIQSLVYRNAFHDEKTLDCQLSRKICCSACSSIRLGSPQKSWHVPASLLKPPLVSINYFEPIRSRPEGAPSRTGLLPFTGGKC